MAEQYQRKTNRIFAMQHDGTDKSAREIENWIIINGGKCQVLASGTPHLDPSHAYIRLVSDRPVNLVGPKSWVVQVGENFYAILDVEFNILYEPYTKELV